LNAVKAPVEFPCLASFARHGNSDPRKFTELSLPNPVQSQQKRMPRTRLLRYALLLLILYLLFCTVGGIYLADGTLHPARRPLTVEENIAVQNVAKQLDTNFIDVSISTQDAITLRAWLILPRHPNGNAALLLHGLGDNRLGMTGFAQLFLAHGYTVLMPDARAHGVSGGELATYGLLERNDIHQWVDFLGDQFDPHDPFHPRCIFALGESMGAAQLLQSLDTHPNFCAVAAESSFATFREIAYDRMGQPFHLGPWVGRILLRPLVEVAFLRARWKYHLDMNEISPEDSVASTATPVLLIHGEIDSNIPVRHSQIIHARNRNTELWEVPHADHCGALSTAPQEFESRLLQWFRPKQ
jgi:pimeloyl-ACP methyl ester carboxylesterase